MLPYINYLALLAMSITNAGTFDLASPDETFFDSTYSFFSTRQALASGNNRSAIINVDQEPSGDLNATAWALIYTYPLAIFSSWSGGVLRNVSVNEIFHQRKLASPDSPGVIKPNVDTLYSRVALDLSEQDVVLTVPPFNDSRYWNYPVYDPYGNNHAEIGVVNGDQPGDYLIRRAEDVPNKNLGFSNDTSTFNSTLYRGVVNLPGSYGTMLIRILLLQNTTEDLNAVHTYQNASRLSQVDRNSSNSAPSLQSLALNGSLLGIEGPAQQLEFAARLVNYSQPEIYSDRQRVSRILSSAGLIDGNYTAPRGINLTEAAVIANASITEDVEGPAHLREEGNDWQLSIASYQGNYGTHYSAAAYVALFGYQQQTILQTLYPGYRSLGFTSVFSLEPNKSLLLSFSGKPQLEEHGFWSLSVYGSDQYLIPNDIYRFEVGDRTYNLTYEDGEPIYGPSANSSRDSPFQILVQPADIQPPTNWTNNWLPAATTFTWICRWTKVQPHKDLTDPMNSAMVRPITSNDKRVVHIPQSRKHHRYRS